MDGVSFSRATLEDIPSIAALIGANGLPLADIGTHISRFITARKDGAIIGVVGMEPGAKAALLRSLAVAAPFRTAGLGARLCEMMEARMRGAGIQEAYLLTETAAAFFQKRGYVLAPREEAPAEIRRTREFQSLCPSSAVCLRKNLHQ